MELGNSFATDELSAWKSSPRTTVRSIPWVEQSYDDTPDTGLAAPRFGDLPKEAPKLTEDAATFLRGEVENNTHAWFRKCLVLQRTARGIPAVAPTALSASQLVPESERIKNLADIRRGMVGFSFDPRIPGTAGHVFFFAGRHNDELITTTNDAKEPGAVDYVTLDFYHQEWGHQFQFAATSLNGYEFQDFEDPEKPPKPKTKKATLGDHYKEMIDELKRIRMRKREKYGPNHPLVLALTNDIERMARHYNAWRPQA